MHTVGPLHMHNRLSFVYIGGPTSIRLVQDDIYCQPTEVQKACIVKIVRLLPAYPPYHQR